MQSQPGTIPRPCLFLDRDGVINRNAPRGEYILSWHQIEILPNIISWIRLFRAAGFLVIVVTNQRGVSLGLHSEADLEALHEQLAATLAAAEAPLDAIFYCPHGLDSCQCRKPAPGMIEEACRRFSIDLSRSLLIGDSNLDAQLAANCQLPFVRVNEGSIVSLLQPLPITGTA